MTKYSIKGKTKITSRSSLSNSFIHRQIQKKGGNENEFGKFSNEHKKNIDIDIYHRRKKNDKRIFNDRKEKRFALLRMINKDIILIIHWIELNWIPVDRRRPYDRTKPKRKMKMILSFVLSSSFILLTFFVHSFNQMFIFFFIIYFNSIEWMNVFSRWLVVWERQEIYFTFEWMKSKRKRSKFIIII